MNIWDQKFDDEDYYYGTDPNEFIKEWGKKINHGNVLAIAEGEGRNAAYLAQLGHNVETWDYSKVGVKKTLQLAKSKGVTVDAKVNDLEHVEWELNKWDAIVNVFGHLPQNIKARTLKGVLKALKPGGVFLTEVYSINQLSYGTGGPKNLELLYAPEIILNTFKGWRFIHFFYGEVERFEGEHHQGLSHVIQAVIQKPNEK